MFAVQNLASAIEKLQPKEGVEFMVTAKNTQRDYYLLRFPHNCRRNKNQEEEINKK